MAISEMLVGARRVTRFLPLLGGVAVVLLGAVSCGGDDDDTAATATTETSAQPTKGSSGGLPANLTTVTISDNKFTPTSLQIPVGANVTWEWTGRNPHSVVGTFTDDEQVTSPKLQGTGVFLYAFLKPGVYEYHCGVHGEAMSGTITVK